MDALISEKRYSRWDPSNFLKKLALLPGEAVLDLGCGPGFWTFPLAEKVGPKGVVWALDVNPEMLETLQRRNPPPQVKAIRAELPVIPLPDASLDWIWVSFAFHEIGQPDRLAVEMRRVLKTDGSVAVLEWRLDAVGRSGPPLRHRLSPDQVAVFLREAEFSSAICSWQDEETFLVEAGLNH